MRRAVTPVTVFVLLLAVAGLGIPWAWATSTDDAHTVPVMDGGIGPCTADFTITDADSKALYDAKIRVHIAYGFMNARKLDLEVGTNVDGKARFTGLPDKIKHGIYFYASQGDLQAEAFDDPANNCKAEFTLALRKKTQ
jgi:hypothetical protein